MAEPVWAQLEGEAFRRELERFKLQNHPFKTHPFFREIERGAAPRDVVQRWAAQFYPWLASVPLAMAERFANCPAETRFDRFRRMILEQLVEEAGDPKGNAPGHPELWLRFCEGLGLTHASVVGTPILPSTMVAIEDFLSINRTEPFYVSAGGSSEPPNVELCRRLMPAFRSHYGVDDDHLAYYSLHVTADVEHSRFVGEMVAAFATAPDVRRRMWDAMLRGFALHRLLVDGATGPAGESHNVK